MINQINILETIHMIDEEDLDIRTITMGISLLDCADSDIDWTKSIAEIDKQLYTKYGLSPEEIRFIETMIAPM